MPLPYEDIYPTPIAAYYSKLHTDECLSSEETQFKYILCTAEAIARFVGAMVLCECRDALEQRPAPLSAGLAADFSKRFKRPSFGVWVQCVREGLKWLTAQETQLFVPELPGFYFEPNGKETPAAQALNQLVTARNKLAHGDSAGYLDFEQLCAANLPLLMQVLAGLEFLLKYELLFASKIEVRKTRRRQAGFLHYLSKFAGAPSNFKGAKEIHEEFMDPALVVLQRVADGKKLVMDPLLVFEPAAGKAPDIFFYNGLFDNGEVLYMACRWGGEFKSAAAARGQELAAEVSHLLELFKQNAGGASV